MVSVQESAEKGDFKLLFMTAIITSMVFVVGLFWNDAMKSFIESFLPATDAVSAKFAAALVVTTLAGFGIFLMYRSMKLAEVAKKEITTQTLRVMKEFDKRRKEMEKRQKKLDRILERTARNI